MTGVDEEIFQNSFKAEYRVKGLFVVIRLHGRDLVIKFKY